jgi:hypothetical protein
MARQDIVVFDPDERPVPSLESMVRPTQPNIIQIQMRGLDEYEMYEAPDKMMECADHELLATRLKMKIRKALMRRWMMTDSRNALSVNTLMIKLVMPREKSNSMKMVYLPRRHWMM